MRLHVIHVAVLLCVIAFAPTVAHAQITIIDEHPRLLIRATPWDGGLSVTQIQARYATDAAFQAQMAPLFSGTRAAYLDEGIKYICTGDTTYATNVINRLLSEDWHRHVRCMGHLSALADRVRHRL